MAKESKQPDDEQARFRPRARLMRTLGDELISSEMVAIIELVKNAYDADATRVLVRFEEPMEPGEGGIDVIDDGHGMTLETVLGAFLEPATSFRQDNARSEEFGRIVTGEKGIGRFAVSRLADELELITRRPGAALETRVLFDWARFDDPEAYLDEIDVAWENSIPGDISPSGLVDVLWPDGDASPDRLERGTALRMRRLRTRWGRDELLALRTGLSRLVSPFLFEESRGSADGFSIYLRAPAAFSDLSGAVEPPEALRSPHYRLHGHVDGEGNYTLSLSLRGAEGTIDRRGRIGVGDLDPTCGPIDIDLRVWDRDPASMRDLGERTSSSTAQVREDLDRAAGINVYRDGFRVLPYGEQGNDWLNLDSRRVQNPTLRLSNNQILGYVVISKETNPELRDQTNREGLLRNRAYEDLRKLVRGVITELETARYGVRPRREVPPRSGQGGLFSGFDLEPVRAYVTEKYPEDKALAKMLGRTQADIEQDVERAQQVVIRYRRLATLGELIDKVLHDGRAPLAKIGDEAILGLRAIDRDDEPCETLLGRVRPRFATVNAQHDALATVFRRMEPFGGRRRGRPTELVLEDVIADGFAVLESDIKRVGVTVALPTTKTTVTVDAAELQEVVINLLTNSLHWLEKVPRSKRKIKVDVARDQDGLHITFSDSGPGVRDDVRESIFDPYFSTKDEGVGLGLSIAGEIVDEYYGGDLELLDEGDLGGATFRVTLRRRV